MINKGMGKSTTYFVGCLFLLAALVFTGHCATSHKRVANSLGVVLEGYSPMAYMVGNPAAVDVFEDNGRTYTNVSFKPLGASMLNTESILFCGNQGRAFQKGDLHVVAYFRSAQRAYQGVGCHLVYKVMEVEDVDR